MCFYFLNLTVKYNNMLLIIFNKTKYPIWQTLYNLEEILLLKNHGSSF